MTEKSKFIQKEEMMERHLLLVVTEFINQI